MIKRQIFLFSALTIGLLMLIVSCDAPRQNPFDPKASNYSESQQQLVTSRIYVRHLFPPFKPVANINIMIQNLNLFFTTNAQGFVEFEHPPVDSLVVLTDAEAYFNRSFVLTAIPTHKYTIYLNAKPQVEQEKFISTYTNFEQSNSTTNLSFNATIRDSDGPMDVSKVVLKNDDYHFALELLRDANDNRYFSSDFAVSQISDNVTNAQLPELNFYLVVQNLNGDSITTGFYSIRRVIETELQLVSPAEGETVRDSVVFKWVNPELPYDYVFNIQMYQYPTFKQLYYRDIPGNQNQFVVKNLSRGQYSWSLQVQDRLGNVCQSYYISFYYE